MRDLGVDLPDGTYRFPNEYHFDYMGHKFYFAFYVENRKVSGATGYRKFSQFVKDTRILKNLSHFLEIEKVSRRDIVKEINEHTKTCPCPLNLFYIDLPKSIAFNNFSKEVSEVIVEHEMSKKLADLSTKNHHIYIDTIDRKKHPILRTQNYFVVALNCSCKKEKEK